MSRRLTSAAGALLLFAAVLLIHGTASAAIFTFGSRAAFDAANPGLSIENWDGFSDGKTFANGSTENGITYNVAPDAAGIAVVTNFFFETTNPNGLGRTGPGDSTPGSEFFATTHSITFGFSAPITAFGIDINTFALSSNAYQAVTNLADVAFSVFDPFPSLETGQFIGFRSDIAFTSVTISAAASNQDQGFTLDTMRYGTAVVGMPEPASLLLFGIALGGIAVMGRRCRKVAQSIS